MSLFKKTILATALLSTTLMAQESSTLTSVSTATASTSKSGAGLIYMAENFTDLAILPSFTLSAPAGFVPGEGVAFIGIAGTTNSNETDGAMAIGMGFGNPNEYFGGALSFGLGSVDPRDGGAMNRGTANLTLGKTISQWDLGVAVGVTDLDLWHNSSSNTFDPSFFATASMIFPEFLLPAVLTLGAGNNAYADIKTSDDPKDSIFPFASLAFYLIPQVSFIADYTSGMTSAGFGITPFPEVPVSFNIGVSDIFSYEREDNAAFMAGLSAAYVF